MHARRSATRRHIHARLTLAAAGAASTLLFLIPPAARADDLATITARVTAQLLASPPSKSTVQNDMNSLQSDGHWTDIDYSNTAQTNWVPLTHLQRLEDMATLYQTQSSSLYHSAALAADISSAYNYWIASDPSSTNWFDNDIAAPQALGNTMVLIHSILSPTQIAQGQTVLARAKNALPSYTGQNVVDLSIPGIDSAIVSGNTADLASAFASMNGTVFISKLGTDGIQSDGTYHIHGIQLYMGGYGTSYVNDMLNWASISAGTSYALAADQEHTIVNYLLDGTQWFIRGKTLDLTADGRQVTFPTYVGAGTGYVGAIQNALKLGDYRTAELQAFLSREKGTISSGSASSTQNTLSGNRYFYDSDIIVQQRPGWYASVKATSSRTSLPETGNAQGLKNLYLGDGVNQIMITGNEYLGIQPSWNWRRLPGTTVEQDIRSLQQTSEWGAAKGSTSYAGGVSDGTYGAEAFNYKRFDVAAKKSWFFFDNEQVALGAAINSSNTTYEVDTTLNQCLLTSTVSYETTSGSIQTFTTGTVTPANLKWVYQGGVGYFFINPVSNATIQAIAQSGAWSSLNTAASSATITQNVFTLYINHGTAVTNGAYSYIAVPGITAASMDAYLANNPIQVLRNDANVQAIRQSSLDLTQAAFYAADTFTMVPNQTIAASAASAIMLQHRPNSLKLSASSPEAKKMALNVTLTGVTLSATPSWLDALGTGTATFNLNGGALAGSTVGITLASDGAASPTVSFTSNDQVTNSAYAATAPVALAANTTLTNDALTAISFTNALTGNAALSKTGPGTLTLSGNNSFHGGLNANAGIVRANSSTALGDGMATVNPGATVVIGAATSTPLTLAGGNLNFSGSPSLSGPLTAAAGTTSTIQIADPAALSTAINVPFTGVLLGSGNLLFANATGTLSPDGGQAFRINASNSGTFSGTLTLLNNVKGELFGTTSGNTTPAGTGTIILTAGDAALANSLNAATTTAGYSELNLRNNTSANQIYGNNVQVTGTGLTLLNPLGSAPAGTSVTLGNLRIGGDQELGTYLAASSATHPILFQSVTLTGGTATFSPKTSGFGSPSSTGADLSLGDITEDVPGSGITMAGLRTLALTGNNTFSGPLTLNSGATIFAPASTSISNIGPISGLTPLAIDTGATVISGAATLPALTIAGKWQLRADTTATSRLNTLVLAGAVNNWTGAADLTNNTLIIEDAATHANTLATLQNQAAYGLTHNAGITSSTRAANQSLLIIDNAAAHLASFGTATNLDDGSILATVAYLGDANLDGKVDIQDLAILNNDWRQSVTNWIQADFNNTNFVDLDDLQILRANWNAGVSGPTDSFAAALDQFPTLAAEIPVPEPATLTLLALAAPLLLKRRTPRPTR